MSRSLPDPELWSQVAAHTGEVSHVRPTARGFSSDVSAVIGSEAGSFFVKAMRNRPGGRRDSLIRERDINVHVEPLAPALRWHAETDTWIAVGFETVEGRSSDFAPGSADLPTVVGILNRIAAFGVPEVARSWAETRWDRFADDSEQELFRGGALLHTDINPSNLMIGEESVWAVDWAWPTLGAAFIDPALWVLQLISAGHTPAAAEAWAGRCVAWERAERAAVDAFARAALRMHREFTRRRPDETWLAAMADAAHGWAAHRGVTG